MFVLCYIQSKYCTYCETKDEVSNYRLINSVITVIKHDRKQPNNIENKKSAAIVCFCQKFATNYLLHFKKSFSPSIIGLHIAEGMFLKFKIHRDGQTNRQGRKSKK